MQVLILIHQKKRNLPPWQMMKGNLAVFNEEAGEIAFSILSRCVLGDHHKSKFEHLNDMYTLVHTYREIDTDIRAETNVEAPTFNWRLSIDPHSEALEATKSFLKLITRRLSRNEVKVYNGKDSKNKKKFEPSAAEDLVPRKKTTPMNQYLNSQSELNSIMEQARSKFMGQSWAHVQVGNIWPEFQFDDHPVNIGYADAGPNAHLEPVVEQAREQKDEDFSAPSSDDEEEHADSLSVATVPNDSSDSSSEDEAPQQPEVEPQERKMGLLDYDANGERRSWRVWGAVDSSNIVSESRAEARMRRRRNISRDVPLLNTSALEFSPSPNRRVRRRR